MNQIKYTALLVLILFLAGCSSTKYSNMMPIPHTYRQLIAISKFTNDTNDKRYDPLMDDLTGSFINELGKTKSFRIVERKRLLSILEEQKLSMTGMVEESSVRRVGKLLGVEAIMLVSLTGVTRTQDETGIGTLRRIDEKIEIEMNARLVDVETGEILATSRVVAPFSRSRTTLRDVFASGDTTKMETVVKKAMQRIAKKLAYEIAYNYRENTVPQYIDD